MQVYRAGTDSTAAGKRNPRRAEACQQWSQHQHRSTHGLDQIIGGLMAVDAGCIYFYNMALTLDTRPERFQHLDSGIYVAQKRHIADLVHSRRQYGCDKDRQRSILGAADRNLTLQLFSTLDDKLVQISSSLFLYPDRWDNICHT